MGSFVQALNVAIYYHGNQLDKQDQPYMMHLIRVAGRGRNEQEMIVGVLHDIVEDTRLGLGYLRVNFGDEVADAVDHLSRREGEEYGDFITRAKKNPLAAYIKLVDVVDHLRGEDAANLSLGLRNRYRLAYRDLTGLDWDKVKHLPDG